MKTDAPLAAGAHRTGSMAARMAWLYAGSSALLLAIAVTFVYFGLVGSLRRQDERLLASKTRVLRLLLRDPLHTKALESEIEHEAGEDQALKYYIRVLDARLQPLHSTPEMDELVPSAAFPPVGDEATGSTIAELHRAGRDFLLLSADAMVLGPDPQRRTVQIALDTSMNREILRDTRHWLMFAFGAGTIFAALGGLIVTRDGLRPLREITAATQSVSASRLDARLHPEAWPAELQNLAAAYDAMLDRLQASFTRLSEFSGDLAHALRNPLHNLRGEAEVALTSARSPEEYRQTLGSLLEEFERLSKLIENLLFLARADNPAAILERVKVSARDELEAVRDFYDALAAERQVAVTCTGDAEIHGDPILLRRAISNLLGNALKHTPPGGRVTLSAATAVDGSVEVRAADTGCGIAREHLDHVFERFFQVETRGAQPPQGAGLGLAIVRSIMHLHGGTAAIISVVGQGTSVTLQFPAGTKRSIS